MARSIKLQPARRQGAAMLTVALASAFVAIVILAITFLNSVTAAQVQGEYESVDFTVTSYGPEIDPAALDDPNFVPPAPEQLSPGEVKKLPGVTEAWVNPTDAYLKVVKDPKHVNTDDAMATNGAFVQATVAKPGTDPSITIRKGKLPASPSEVVIDQAYADDHSLAVGDQIHVQSLAGGKAVTLTVSGIRDTPASALLQPAPFVLTLDGITQMLDPELITYFPVFARISPDANMDDIVAAAEAKNMSITTVKEIQENTRQMQLQMAIVLGMLFGAFVAIALLTAALVVANTFAVTVAQRRRSFALLRALGATRAQVVRVVLKDAAIVGLVGAAIGVLLAYGLGAIGMSILRSMYSTAIPMVPPFSLIAIIVPLILGTLMTVIAGLVPAFSATKVRPVEAMRPIEATRGKGAGIIRTALAGLALFFGLIALALAFMMALQNAPTTEQTFSPMPLLLGILGGALSMIGIVLGTLVIVPAAMRIAGAITSRVGGIPGRFAALNAGRHPRRSAATIVALVIGTALMTTMAVGANTGERSVLAELNESAPIDVVAADRFFTDTTATDLAKVQGMDTTVSALATNINTGNADDPMTVIGVKPGDLASVSRLDGLEAELKDGEVIVGKSRAERFNLKDGDTIMGPSGQKATVRVYKDITLSLTTPATVQQLDQKPAIAVLGKFLPKDSPQRKSSDLVTFAQETHGALMPTSGDSEPLIGDMPGFERELVSTVINGLLIFVTVMLAVAVIVALVGVMNTLSLSVVERTGENALLRALGTSASQIRAMLAWEGVIMSLIGTLIGVVAGIVFGLVGARVVIPAYTQFQPGIPWLLLLGVAVLAMIAGLLASVIPGRTAAKVQPAAALAARDQ